MILKKVINISDSRTKIIFTSLFYGALLALLANNYYLFFNSISLGWNALIFVFLSTFTYYYYQKKIAFAIHFPFESKLNYTDYALLMLPGIWLVYYFFKLEFPTQCILFLTILICLLYHNHSSYFFLRNIPLIKNSIISLSWVSISILSFNYKIYPSNLFLYIVFDFFILVLCQSLLFDYAEKSKDQYYGHKTFSGMFKLSQLFIMIRILAVLGILFIILLKQQGQISVLSLVVQLIIYLSYFTPAFQKLIKENKMSVYATDILFLIKAISLNF